MLARQEHNIRDALKPSLAKAVLAIPIRNVDESNLLFRSSQALHST